MTAILQLSGAIREVYPDFSTQQFDGRSRAPPNSVGASCVPRTEVGPGCGGSLTCQKFTICNKKQNSCSRYCDDQSKLKCDCVYAYTHKASSTSKKPWRSGHYNPASPCDPFANENPDAPLPFKLI